MILVQGIRVAFTLTFLNELKNAREIEQSTAFHFSRIANAYASNPPIGCQLEKLCTGEPGIMLGIVSKRSNPYRYERRANLEQVAQPFGYTGVNFCLALFPVSVLSSNCLSISVIFIGRVIQTLMVDTIFFLEIFSPILPRIFHY
jgi:hypothetical protein